MPRKPGNKQRTRVKDLPKKEKRLSKGDMKKVKGGIGALAGAIIGFKTDEKPKPKGFAGDIGDGTGI